MKSAGWPVHRLGDVVDFLDHRRRPVKESDRKPGPYPYYGANAQQGWIDDYIFDEPLILLAEDGGNFGSKTRPIAYAIQGKTWVNNHAHVLRPNSLIDIRYLLRQLEFYDVRSIVNGATRSKLNKSDAEKIEISVPPLEEQKRIAAILDKADSLRRKRQQATLLAYDFLRAVFLDRFGDPESNPMGFPRGTIRDLVESANYGTSEKASEHAGELPVLRMNNITYEGNWDLSALKFVDLDPKIRDKYLAYKGDILFNRTNSVELVGKTAVYELDEPMALAGYLVRVRVNASGDPYYVAGYLNSKHGKSTLRGIAKSIVGMANINAQEMQNIPILLPPAEQQREYGRIVQQVRAHLKIQQQSLDEIQALIDSLTSQCFGNC